MSQKRNVRKSSRRHHRIVAAIVIGVSFSALAVFLRLRRSPGEDADLSSLPDATESWRTAPEAPDIGTTETASVEPETTAPVTVETGSEFVDDFTYLTQTDPRAASELLARLNEGEDRDEKLAQLIGSWVESDPEAAAAWVAAIPAGTFLEDATGQLVLHWGESAPEAAAAWVAGNVASGRQPTGASTFASTWTRRDPTSAIAWADALENAAAKKEAYSAIAHQLGLDDPARAGSWIATVDDPALLNALATGLLSSWSGTDPAAAAAWLSGGGLGNGSGSLRRKAALMLVSQWTIDDPRPASIWINELAEGPLKEDSKVALAQTLSTEAPNDALIWADSIIDPTERQDVILDIYEDWIGNNPSDFKTQLVQRWSRIADPEVRKGIYGLLYDYDPAFKEEVVQLIEKAVTE